MKNLVINMKLLTFSNDRYVHDAVIELDYDSDTHEAEVQSVSGEFEAIQENTAIDLLNEDWEQITDEVNLESYIYDKGGYND